MFPSNPNVGDEFTMSDGRTFQWNGVAWVLVDSGGGGATGARYTHTQSTQATDWGPISHQLNFRYVLVQVVDTAGNTVIPDVTYTDNNNVDLTFANPKQGTAIIRR